MSLKTIREYFPQLFRNKISSRSDLISYGKLQVDKLYWRYEGKNEPRKRIILSIASQTNHDFIKPITHFLNSEQVSCVKLNMYTSYTGLGNSAICAGTLFFLGKYDLIKQRNILLEDSLKNRVEESVLNDQQILYFADFIEVLGIISISKKCKSSLLTIFI